MKLTKKQSLIIIGVFFIVALAFTTSLAFFTYSRTGTKRISITAGEVTFSYNEGTSATLATAFPISDTVGAVDTTGEYLFDVTYNGTNAVKYNVFLVSNNTTPGTNYFKNNQIKFALVKNGGFVGNTSATQGLKVSDLEGFNLEESTGEGKVLDKQEITTGQTDNYKLRIWISDDVDYTNTIDENGTSTGKYNGYQYSLVVKVTTDDSVAQNSQCTTNFDFFHQNFDVVCDPASFGGNSYGEDGLYFSNDTNSGKGTYFFRGNVQNNYLRFADLDWRILRFNEDGTIRIRLANAINDNQQYAFNYDGDTLENMYYTNSEIKPILDNWYQEAIGNNPEYASKVASGNYFCEQAKVRFYDNEDAGNASTVLLDNYTPNFKCETDGNGKGLVNSSVGLITVDEAFFAGANFEFNRDNIFLYNVSKYDYTMSPSGYDEYYDQLHSWRLAEGTVPASQSVMDDDGSLYPVINLNPYIDVSGTGTEMDPFVVQ